MSYLGQAALKNSELKRFDVTSSTSANHVLSWTAPNEQSLWITINGVKQQDDAYTIAGVPTTITLTDALVATDKMEVIGVLDIGVITIVGDNTISTAKLGDTSVTTAKLGDTSVTAAKLGALAVTNAKMADDAVGVAELSATGTASATTYLRGDNAWGAVVTSPVGAGTDKVFFENEMTVDTNYTVTANNNAMSAGIVTVAAGITVTLTGTSVWTIV
jgi:hypothetical protein